MELPRPKDELTNKSLQDTTPSVASTTLWLSLTLQYFCEQQSQQVSYGTIKVYLAGIWLANIKSGIPDPTGDSLLQLVCRDIRQLQGDNQHTHFHTTVNLLRTLKNQLGQSVHSYVEQRMLWAAFSMAFYGFQSVSEFNNLH